MVIQASGQPLSAPSPTPANAVPICKQCSYAGVEEGYEFPLCWDCRHRLSTRAFPRAIIGVGALVVLAFVFAATYYPDAFRASMTYAAGRRAEQAKDFDGAIFAYETVLSTFPHSPLVAAHLGIAYYRSGNIPLARSILSDLREQQLPLEIVKQIDAILAETPKPAGVK